jgi:hypothetical protein
MVQQKVLLRLEMPTWRRMKEVSQEEPLDRSKSWLCRLRDRGAGFMDDEFGVEAREVILCTKMVEVVAVELSRLLFATCPVTGRTFHFTHELDHWTLQNLEMDSLLCCTRRQNIYVSPCLYAD